MDTPKEGVNELIERRKHEDTLLNTRTGIILTFNGLMAIAISRGKIPIIVSVFVVLLIVVIDALWIGRGREAVRYIRALGQEIQKYPTLSPSQALWKTVSYDKRWFKSLGPTKLVGEIIPILLLVAWVGGLWLVGLYHLFTLFGQCRS